MLPHLLRICNANAVASGIPAVENRLLGGLRDGAPRPFSVLVVCSANICRSPYAEQVLRRWARLSGEEDTVTLASAGVSALPGQPMCREAALHLELDPSRHASRELTPAVLDAADLIVTADRSHRGAAARMLPSCRSRLFTLRQAGKLGMTLALRIVDGDLPDGAPPFPTRADERLRWLVGEFDAARGQLAGSPEAEADIEDRHGPAPHDDTFAQVAAAIANLTAAFDATLGRP